MKNINIILKGIVGSRAYGLETEASDTDLMTIFQYHTSDFWDLDKLQNTSVHKKPGYDFTYHEIAKYLYLLIKGNPSVLELLYLPQELILQSSRYGEFLIDNRQDFLSETVIRESYAGYARSQYEKVHDIIFYKKPYEPYELSLKAQKMIVHAFRLLEQGTQLLLTGDMSIRVEDINLYHTIKSINNNTELYSFSRQRFYKSLNFMLECKSVLPNDSAKAKKLANELLYAIRENDRWEKI